MMAVAESCTAGQIQERERGQRITKQKDMGHVSDWRIKSNNRPQNFPRKQRNNRCRDANYQPRHTSLDPEINTDISQAEQITQAQ